MKKKILVSIAILISFLHLNAQTPNWTWVTQKGGTFIDRGESIATDPNGNILTVGSSNGNYFLDKQDASGNLLWSKTTGDGKCVRADANSNVYVTGVFSSPSITFGSTTLTNAGADDMFIVKYDSVGNVLWAKKAGGSGDDFSYSLSIDANGNIIVAGIFGSASIVFGSDTLTNKGIFVTKFDSNGNVLWAKSASNNNVPFQWNCAVGTDKSGFIYVTGNFLNSPLIFGIDTLTSSGDQDVFIVKYDPNGNLLWAKSEGGSSFDYNSSAAVDPTGNIYVAGFFWSASITFGSTTLVNQGYTDMFIVKYDTDGNLLWAKSPVGTGNEDAYNAVTDTSGNLYVTGYFNEHLDFNGTTFTTAGETDIFVAKYDPNGNVLWAKSTGGPNGDNGFGIAVDKSENVYVTGFFKSSPITFGSTTLTSAGWHDVFVAKLGSTTLSNISNQEKESGILKLYPNPTGSVFLINYSTSEPISDLQLEIKNVAGQIIYNKRYKSFNGELKDEIDLGKQPKGVYFLEIIGNNIKQTKKIIIQ